MPFKSYIHLNLKKIIAIGAPIFIALLLTAIGIQACGHTGGPRVAGC